MDNKPSNTDRMSRPGFGGFFTSCISGYFDVICLYVFYAIGGRMSIPILIKLISEFSVLLYELLITHTVSTLKLVSDMINNDDY